MDTGQVLTLDSQRMAMNYITSVLIKANPQGYVLPAFVQLGASIHPDVVPAYPSPTPCDRAHPVQLDQPTLFTEWKTWLVILHEQPQHSRKVSVLG